MTLLTIIFIIKITGKFTPEKIDINWFTSFDLVLPLPGRNLLSILFALISPEISPEKTSFLNGGDGREFKLTNEAKINLLILLIILLLYLFIFFVLSPENHLTDILKFTKIVETIHCCNGGESSDSPYIPEKQQRNENVQKNIKKLVLTPLAPDAQPGVTPPPGETAGENPSFQKNLSDQALRRVQVKVKL